ncbi:MAG: hypothetical protein NTW74_06660 [Acidobacteria bacterium]|nr:hypothetical protein [Acidobacteriota bacterium]
MTLLILTALEILNLVAGAEERQQEMRARYVYQEVQENWRLDPYGQRIQGSERSKTFDVILLQGQRYRKMIARNGKPLTPAEQWEVEEDMKRVVEAKPATTSLRDLASTHKLAIKGDTLEAVSETKSHTFTIDSRTHEILRHITQNGTTRMTIDYTRLPDGTTLPSKVEVDFTVGDVHGIQRSTFSNFALN